jgi:hypothetical protein
MRVPREPWRLLVLVSIALFLAHAALFRDWLIDDAGISLAYARTLAEGHGLRAQPGVAAVEGFSNPLWTLLLAGGMDWGLPPALAPKLLSLVLVAAAFLTLALACRRGATSALAAALPLLLLPLNTSFVVWTVSGLENPLLVTLVVLSCALGLEAARDPRERKPLDLASGAVAGLLALTRPDGVVYAAAYPASVFAGGLAPTRLRHALAGGVVAFVALTAVRHGARSRDFAEDPVVPFSRVAAFGGHGYNRLADIVGRPGISLLTPDMGGALFYSRMRVYDLAGLCDRVIAHTLRADRPAFLHYVFDEARPTFIHVHASWAEWADLAADPRLRRDYVAIAERHDGPEEWRREARADVPWSADYVRRDALGGDRHLLARLQEAFRAQGMPALSP